MRNLAFGNIEEAQGLPEAERELMRRLMEVFTRNQVRNETRTKYYEGKIKVKNIGIAVPPQLESLEVSCCWPQKAVEALQSRSVFDGFVVSDDAVSEHLASIARRNDLRARYSRAVIPQLVHGCAFATVMRKEDGTASIRFRTAERAAALWEGESDRIEAGFVVVDSQRHNNDMQYTPCLVHLHTKSAIWVLSRNENSDSWHAKELQHPAGRPLMEPLVYRASEDKPFGKSRITRPVMALTDSYLREMLRLEVGAELFTSPQKAILGAGDEAFEMDKYNAYVTNMLLIGKDEDGNVPTLMQLNAASMQPHVEVMRNLAAQFAGATCVPVSELGVIHDNPISADAIHAAEKALIAEVENSLNASNAEALRNIALMALAIEDNHLNGLPDTDFTVKFKNPAMPSMAAQADAMMKVVAPAPWIAESEVYLEQVGLDEGTRRRLMSDKLKAQSNAAINALFGGMNDGANPA